MIKIRAPETGALSFAGSTGVVGHAVEVPIPHRFL